MIKGVGIDDEHRYVLGVVLAKLAERSPGSPRISCRVAHLTCLPDERNTGAEHGVHTLDLCH